MKKIKLKKNNINNLKKITLTTLLLIMGAGLIIAFTFFDLNINKNFNIFSNQKNITSKTTNAISNDKEILQNASIEGQDKSRIKLQAMAHNFGAYVILDDHNEDQLYMWGKSDGRRAMLAQGGNYKNPIICRLRNESDARPNEFRYKYNVLSHGDTIEKIVVQDDWSMTRDYTSTTDRPHNNFGMLVKKEDGSQKLYMSGLADDGHDSLSLSPVLSNRWGPHYEILDFNFCPNFRWVKTLDTEHHKTHFWYWGYNRTGLLVDHARRSRYSKIEAKNMVELKASDFNAAAVSIKSITSNAASAAAIVTQGGKDHLYMWGWNNFYQAGVAAPPDNMAKWDQAHKIIVVPTEVKDLAKQMELGDSIKQVSLSGVTSSAVVHKADGTDKLYMWGYNKFGQQGIGKEDTSEHKVHLVSITNDDLLPGNKYTILKTSLIPNDSSVLIHFNNKDKDEKSLYIWGDNKLGTVGQGTDESSYTKPTKVNLEYKHKYNPSSKFKISSYVLGGRAVSVLFKEHFHEFNWNTTYMWGDNSDNQQGNGKEIGKVTKPTQRETITTTCAKKELKSGYEWINTPKNPSINFEKSEIGYQIEHGEIKANIVIKQEGVGSEYNEAELVSLQLESRKVSATRFTFDKKTTQLSFGTPISLGKQGFYSDGVYDDFQLIIEFKLKKYSSSAPQKINYSIFKKTLNFSNKFTISVKTPEPVAPSFESKESKLEYDQVGNSLKIGWRFHQEGEASKRTEAQINYVKIESSSLGQQNPNILHEFKPGTNYCGIDENIHFNSGSLGPTLIKPAKYSDFKIIIGYSQKNYSGSLINSIKEKTFYLPALNISPYSSAKPSIKSHKLSYNKDTHKLKASVVLKQNGDEGHYNEAQLVSVQLLCGSEQTWTFEEINTNLDFDKEINLTSEASEWFKPGTYNDWKIAVKYKKLEKYNSSSEILTAILDINETFKISTKAVEPKMIDHHLSYDSKTGKIKASVKLQQGGVAKHYNEAQLVSVQLLCGSEQTWTFEEINTNLEFDKEINLTSKASEWFKPGNYNDWKIAVKYKKLEKYNSSSEILTAILDINETFKISTKALEPKMIDHHLSYDSKTGKIKASVKLQQGGVAKHYNEAQIVSVQLFCENNRNWKFKEIKNNLAFDQNINLAIEAGKWFKPGTYNRWKIVVKYKLKTYTNYSKEIVETSTFELKEGFTIKPKLTNWVLIMSITIPSVLILSSLVSLIYFKKIKTKKL